MAKRKRLNRRVAVLLGAMGAVLVALVLTILIRGTGSGGFLDRLFPRDPEALLQQAEAAQEAGRYRDAAELHSRAVDAARSAEVPDMHRYYLERGQFSYHWAERGTGLTKTQRGERFRQAVSDLRRALLRKQDFVPAQETLCDIYWKVALQSRGEGWEQFIREADAYLELDPNNAEICFRRGLARSQLASRQIPGDKAKGAIADMERAIELDKDHATYWLGLARFLGQLTGYDARVEETFRQAVRTVPDNPTILIGFARHLRSRGQNDEAERHLHDAIKQDPILGKLALADHYAATDRTTEAVALLRDVRQADELDPRGYLREARIHMRQDKHEQAVAVLEEGIAAAETAGATQPADPESRESSRRTRAELYYLLADVLLEMIEQETGDSEQLLAKARDCLSKLTTLNVRGPMLAKTAGRVALAEGKPQQAMEQLEAALRGLGFDLKVANLLINLYMKQNLPGKADAILDRLLSIPSQQRNVSALLAKARLLMRYRDYEKAYRTIQQVLKQDPGNAAALNLGMALRAVRGEAPTLPEGMEPDAQTVAMLLRRASMMWLDDRQDEAIRYVEQLHQRVPGNRQVLGQLFSMYRRAQRLEDAEKLIDKALELFPDDATFQARRRLIHEQDPEKQYAILLEVADEYEPLQAALEKAEVARRYGREGEYIEFLDQAAAIDANAPAVVDSLFRYALGKKDWKLAEECIERAEKKNLDGAQGRLYQMRLAMMQRDYDTVIATALAVLQDNESRKEARVGLAQAYLQKEMFEEAYKEFKIVAENDPGYAPAAVGLAIVTGRLGKEDEHRHYVYAAHRLAPRNEYVRQEYLRYEQQDASPEELIVQRERDMKRKPNDLQNLAALARLYERVQRYADAEKMYTTVHQKSEDKLYSARLLGGFYARRGRWVDVQRVLEPLVSNWKDRVGARVLYGQLFAEVDPERARRAFEGAITADPEDARGHLGMARYWARLRNWPKAVEAMRTYIRLRPDDTAGVKELVRYALEAGQFDYAEDRIAELLEASPDDAAAITLKGVLAMKRGKYPEAHALLGRAIQNNPTYAEPLIWRAQAFLAQGDTDKAKQDLQAAKRLSNRVDVAMQLGSVYQTVKDYDKAELVYREILQENKDYTPAIDRLLSIYARRRKWGLLEELLVEAKELHPNRVAYLMAEANMWKERQNQEKMLAAMARAVQTAPDSTATLRVYLLALQEADLFDRALTVTEPYKDKPGFSGWVAAVRGAALAKAKRLDEAKAAFLKALETIRADQTLLVVHELQEAYGIEGGIEKLKAWQSELTSTWRTNLVAGVLHGEAKQFAEALEYLKRARALAGDKLSRFLAERHLGAMHYQLKQFDEAEKVYLSALKIRPDDIQILNNLAYLYTNDLNQPARALPFASRAAERRPDNAKVLDTYGWTLAKVERFADAEQALVRAVQLEKPLAASRYHLGWVYERLGRLDEALKQYRQGFEMVRDDTADPLHAPLRAALERVQREAEGGSDT